MDFWDSLKMAGNTLVTNKLRSSLTMLGIIIGNASVITMIGVGQGAQKLAEEQFKSLGPNILFVIPGSPKAQNSTFNLPKTLVLADAQAIAKQVPTIAGIAPEINRRQLVSYRNQNTTGLLIGTSEQYAAVRSFEIDFGRFLSAIDLQRQKRVVVLGSDIAERLFLAQSPIGKSIRIRGISFEVVGVMQSKGALLGTDYDEALFIPLTVMANQIVGRTSPFGLELSWINVEARDQESIRAAKFQIENLLRLRHKITTDEDDFGVRTAKQMIDIVGTISQGLTVLLAAIAAISLVVGGIGVMNIMLVSVTERTGEIGLRKALGAQESDILLQFLIEAVIVSLIGGVIGIATGTSGVFLIALFSPLQASVSWSAIALSGSVSGIVGLCFGVIPAHRAAKLDPIVALRRA